MDKNIEIIIISIIAGIFIYFRELNYYRTIPKGNIYASVAIILWSYLVLKVSPWFLIVGLVGLNLYGIKLSGL